MARIMASFIFTVLSICLNIILLISVIYRARSALSEYDVPCLSTTASCTESWCDIRSTQESLYDMYGEGYFAGSDEHLLNYIRSLTSRQGPGGRRLSAKSKVDFSQVGGSSFVDELLEGRRNGFFVECGAFIGEALSDTLFFELERNWTGILIEAHPEYHREILRKNRHALVLRACLSSNPHPSFVKFRLTGYGSGVSSLSKNVARNDTTVPETDVQCFSLNSIMEAIGIRHIDFMVLDVEGSELPVLETIDWTKLSVDVFSIEYSDYNRVSKLNKIRRYFNRTGGYKEVGRLPMARSEDVTQDVVFMRV